MVINENAAKRKTLLDRTISFCQDKRIDSTSLLQVYLILSSHGAAGIDEACIDILDSGCFLGLR